MTEKRDVAAFGQRARGYEDGRLGRFHQEIAVRVASIALAAAPTPIRILDVGCGTGQLLRLLAQRYPNASALCGIDASPEMVAVAREASVDSRIEIREGEAERLQYSDHEFDLIVSTTSFDHWHDQLAGLAECKRVLDHNGTLVLADLFSPLMHATLIGARRDKARTRRRVEHVLAAVGLHLISWQKVYPLISAFTARNCSAS